jgi:serine/threonine protein kinase
VHAILRWGTASLRYAFMSTDSCSSLSLFCVSYHHYHYCRRVLCLQDVWGAGCVIFSLLSGRFNDNGPFATGGENEVLESVYQSILEKRLVMDHIANPDARALLRSMLAMVPDQRVSVSEALEHKWLAPVESSPKPTRRSFTGPGTSRSSQSSEGQCILPAIVSRSPRAGEARPTGAIPTPRRSPLCLAGASGDVGEDSLNLARFGMRNPRPLRPDPLSAIDIQPVEETSPFTPQPPAEGRGRSRFMGRAHEEVVERDAAPPMRRPNQSPRAGAAPAAGPVWK